MAGGWLAALRHGFVETRSAPTSLAEVARRLRRARFFHALALTGVGAGSLLMTVWASDSPALLVTSFLLVVGLMLRPAARGRKAATALARDLDRVLRLHDVPCSTVADVGANQKDRLRRREALDDLVISGSTGIDTGVAVGWWGLRAVHPLTLAEVADAASGGLPLSSGLAETLAAYRAALGAHLDVAA